MKLVLLECDLDDEINRYLSLLVEVEQDVTITKPYQELVFQIGTIQTAICKHMHKEEKQKSGLEDETDVPFSYYIENSGQVLEQSLYTL
ncbi:hypothetical protein QQ045_020337 [Rhodiola kirilowii]